MKPERMAARARRLAAFALALAMSADAAPVYRQVDEDGLAVFSDRPVASLPGAVEVWSGNAASVWTSLPTPPLLAASALTKEAEATGYRVAAVAFPADGETVRANGGELLVRARVAPPLRAGHRALLRIDGANVAEVAGPAPREDLAFAVAGLARGQREARIEVFDEDGDALLQSVAARFQLLRAAVSR